MTATTSTTSTTSAPESIRVWDVPVRLFHWLMVLCFAGAWLTAESDSWRLLHITLGYTMAGLVAFRVLWGFIGSRYARFSEFVRGPKAIWSYLESLLRGQAEHYTGHNPAGAVAIVLMLTLTALIVVTGWATYNELGGEVFEEVHEAIASLMLGVVGVHLVGVFSASWFHHENLAKAMVTGRKAGAPQEGIGRARWGVAVLLVAAVLGFWWVQWQGAADGAGVSVIQPHSHEKHHHDD